MPFYGGAGEGEFGGFEFGEEVGESDFGGGGGSGEESDDYVLFYGRGENRVEGVVYVFT